MVQVTVFDDKHPSLRDMVVNGYEIHRLQLHTQAEKQHPHTYALAMFMLDVIEQHLKDAYGPEWPLRASTPKS